LLVSFQAVLGPDLRASLTSVGIGLVAGTLALRFEGARARGLYSSVVPTILFLGTMFAVVSLQGWGISVGYIGGFLAAFLPERRR
jgi:hypothetical protein